MKLAYLFSRYAVPSQTFCDTEMRALEALGYGIEIHSISPPTTAFRHEPATRPRATVRYAPHSRVLDRWELRARREGRWPGALIADHERRFGPEQDPARRARHALYFADLCRRRGIGHVHVHFAAHAVHSALFFASFNGPTFSFTAHGQDFMTDLGNDDLLREMAAHAAFVIAVSDWSRDLLRAKCPASADRITRIHNGLSFPAGALLPGGASADAPPARPVHLLSVGRLIEFKGFHVLLAACAELLRRGLDFTCDILGEGPWRPTLETLIAEHGLAERIRLPGLRSQAEVHAAMAGCDIFVLACVFDRGGACDVLPTVILEAMAAARPVVSTTLAGVPELVIDGETGRLAPPADAPALADALEDLIRSSDRRARLGLAGRERLQAHFRAEASARQLATRFEEVAASSPPAPPDLPEAPVRLVYLLAHCPGDAVTPADDSPPLCAEWKRLRERLEDAPASVRFFSLRPPARRLDPEAPGAGTTRTPSAVAWWLEPLEFLPDGMVLEGGWREAAALAHRMEGWREETAGSLGTEDYLLQARRALWLHRRLNGASSPRPPGVSSLHLHAVGSGALLCAWILRRLAEELNGARVTASFWLERRGPTREMPGSAIRRLARDCVGGRIRGDAPLVTALGEWPFELDPTDVENADENWIARLLGWAGLGQSKPHTTDLLDD